MALIWSPDDREAAKPWVQDAIAFAAFILAVIALFLAA